MKKIISIAILTVATSACASLENGVHATTSNVATQSTTVRINADKGLVTLKSNDSVEDTANKLKALIESKGMKIFATVDHQKNAAGVDMALRPTQVIMFGNPKAGTPLMQCEQTVAIDLPQKILISEDAQGNVWLSYNNPAYLQSRHRIQGCDEVIRNISMTLNTISSAAVAK